MTLTDRDNLLIEAAIEFGPDYFYDIRNGTLGITLYITAPNKAEARHARKASPSVWKDLYIIVLYTTTPEFSDEVFYDPKLS